MGVPRVKSKTPNSKGLHSHHCVHFVNKLHEVSTGVSVVAVFTNKPLQGWLSLFPCAVRLALPGSTHLLAPAAGLLWSQLILAFSRARNRHSVNSRGDRMKEEPSLGKGRFQITAD